MGTVTIHTEPPSSTFIVSIQNVQLLVSDQTCTIVIPSGISSTSIRLDPGTPLTVVRGFGVGKGAPDGIDAYLHEHLAIQPVVTEGIAVGFGDYVTNGSRIVSWSLESTLGPSSWRIETPEVLYANLYSRCPFPALSTEDWEGVLGAKGRRGRASAIAVLAEWYMATADPRSDSEMWTDAEIIASSWTGSSALRHAAAQILARRAGDAPAPGSAVVLYLQVAK